MLTPATKSSALSTLTSRHSRPITTAISASQSTRFEYAGSEMRLPGPRTHAADALMKCHGLSPSSCGSGSGGRFSALDLSATGSRELAPADGGDGHGPGVPGARRPGAEVSGPCGEPLGGLRSLDVGRSNFLLMCPAPS